jgi:glutamyl-tRNA synthetase
LSNHGTLVFRNEDLDPQRSRPEFALAMMEDLRWLGIEWQEGPGVGGPFAPYAQSQRRDFYLAVWRTLLDGGWIYPCSCSRRDLAAAPQAPSDEGELIYPGTCRCRVGERALTPAGANWRFRVPDGARICFTDLLQGEQEYTAGRDFGDFLVWRRDDVPAYQLAVVADDQAMQITEVVRGADLLVSTARQLLLLRALRVSPPVWAHCDLVRDADGQRLAKRHDSMSLRALRQSGLSPKQVREMIFHQ